MILGSLFLITSFLAGYVLVVRLLPRAQSLFRVVGACLVGMNLGTWTAFLLSLFFFKFLGFGERSIEAGFSLTIVINLSLIGLNRRIFLQDTGLKTKHFLVLAACFLSGWVLFGRSLGWDAQTQTIQLASFIYSDYRFHIPLIRSFSAGNNLDLLSPLFANERLYYHFFLYFLAGALERFGFSINWALNLPTIFSWTCLLVGIFHLGKNLFYQSKWVGWCSVFLFLFNSSLAYIAFFQGTPQFSVEAILQASWKLDYFIRNGLWAEKIIAPYWSLHNYNYQKHMIFGFATVVFVVGYLIKIYLLSNKGLHAYKQYFLLGLLSGLLVFWHGPAFLGLFLIEALFFLLLKNKKQMALLLIVAGMVAAPQIFWFKQAKPVLDPGHVVLSPGYIQAFSLPSNFFLYSQPFLSEWAAWAGPVIAFLVYWFFNIGLSLIFIPLSFFFMKGRRRTILLIFSFLFFFAFCFNFYHSSTSKSKIFLLWILLSNPFTAYVLYRIYKERWYMKIAAIVLLLGLTLSGLLQMMPYKNFPRMILLRTTPAVEWIRRNTSPDAVFWVDPEQKWPAPSLAGRFVFEGGHRNHNRMMRHPVRERMRISKAIIEEKTKAGMCELLLNNRIDYVEKIYSHEMGGRKEDVLQEHFDVLFEEKAGGSIKKYFWVKSACTK